jgi:hypothetical protein
VAVANASAAGHGGGGGAAGLIGLAGDIHHSGRAPAYLSLPAGRHALYVRVRAKHRAAFTCSAARAPGAAGLAAGAPTPAPDVVVDPAGGRRCGAGRPRWRCP